MREQRGAWLIAIGMRVTRRETFERMVAPAIADMQFEWPHGQLRRWKYYGAIGAVLIHAVVHDIWLDVSGISDAEAKRTASIRTSGRGVLKWTAIAILAGVALYIAAAALVDPLLELSSDELVVRRQLVVPPPRPPAPFPRSP